MVSVRKRTIPTERPPLVNEDSAKFFLEQLRSYLEEIVAAPVQKVENTAVGIFFYYHSETCSLNLK
jgi:hypothetical protein